MSDLKENEGNNSDVPERALTPQEEQFNKAWLASFGVSSVQVFFLDKELNARVYTLDGDSGYNVKHKKISSKDQPDAVDPVEDSQKLCFPSKARLGEEHGRARLKKEEVIAIRAWAQELIEKGLTPPWTTKSQELKVSEGTLRDIVNRRTWTHV